MSDAFLLSAARTPIGKFLGGLPRCPPRSSGPSPWARRSPRGGRRPRQIEEVIFGNVLQAGLGQNPARQAALAAGLPDTIAAVTVNKVCGSGLKAVMLAAQAIRAGDADLVAAGGMESMSRAPHLLMGARAGWKFGDQKAVDAMIHDGLWCAFEDWHMGEAAEHIAGKCGVTPRRAGPLLGPEPAPGRGGVGAGRLCRRARRRHGRRRGEGEAGQPRRGRPPRDDGRGAGEAQARRPGRRHGHRGRRGKNARRQGLIVAAIAAVVFAGVGFVAGQASEISAGRTKSVADATDLSQDVTKVARPTEDARG